MDVNIVIFKVVDILVLSEYIVCDVFDICFEMFLRKYIFFIGNFDLLVILYCFGFYLLGDLFKFY